MQGLHINKLRITDIISFAKEHFDIDDYLLTFNNPKKLPDRSWICIIGKRQQNQCFSEHFGTQGFQIVRYFQSRTKWKELRTKEEARSYGGFRVRFTFQVNKSCFTDSRGLLNFFGRQKREIRKTVGPGRKRKVWEIEREHNLSTNRHLEKDNKMKERIINILKEEVKEFELKKLPFLKSEES